MLPISRSIPLYISLQMPTRLLMLTEDSIIYTRNNTTVECYYCINNTRSNLTFWQKTSRQRKIKRLSAFARNVRPRIPYIGQPFYIPISISTLPTRHSTFIERLITAILIIIPTQVLLKFVTYLHIMLYHYLLAVKQ